MPTTTSIDTVTTGDAAPTTAPHRISNKSGKNDAQIKFTPTHDGNIMPGPYLIPQPNGIDIAPGMHLPTQAYRIRMGGSGETSGTLLTSKGRVCGGELCGARPCSSWTSASGAQLTDDVTYAETGGPADGAQTVYIYVNTLAQGWS